jgi:hypothetical protein
MLSHYSQPISRNAAYFLKNRNPIWLLFQRCHNPNRNKRLSRRRHDRSSEGGLKTAAKIPVPTPNRCESSIAPLWMIRATSKVALGLNVS